MAKPQHESISTTAPPATPMTGLYRALRSMSRDFFLRRIIFDAHLRRMYHVSKTIDFCYGHRILGHNGPCRHLHGHNARVELIVATETLDACGMGIDFRALKDTMKTWIDATWDHRLLLHSTDPLFPLLREAGEPIVPLEVAPTAEHLARLLFEHGRSAGLPLHAVRFWETPSSCAMYTE